MPAGLLEKRTHLDTVVIDKVCVHSTSDHVEALAERVVVIVSERTAGVVAVARGTGRAEDAGREVGNGRVEREARTGVECVLVLRLVVDTLYP